MDTSINCVLCGKKLISANNKCVYVKERGLKTLRKCNENSSDEKYLLFKDKTEIKVHKKCQVDYLLFYNVQPGSSTSSDISTRSVSSSFEFSKLCLFCGKNYH